MSEETKPAVSAETLRIVRGLEAFAFAAGIAPADFVEGVKAMLAKRGEELGPEHVAAVAAIGPFREPAARALTPPASGQERMARHGVVKLLRYMSAEEAKKERWLVRNGSPGGWLVHSARDPEGVYYDDVEEVSSWPLAVLPVEHAPAVAPEARTPEPGSEASGTAPPMLVWYGRSGAPVAQIAHREDAWVWEAEKTVIGQDQGREKGSAKTYATALRDMLEVLGSDIDYCLAVPRWATGVGGALRAATTLLRRADKNKDLRGGTAELEELREAIVEIERLWLYR